MNIQPNNNNISMTGIGGKKPSSWQSIKNRVKQGILDTLPSATFKDENKVEKWKKIEERISKPAENRLIMGATAILTQPVIDMNNKKVDEETRRVSRNRTIAKILIGTGVGICIRGSCYELVQKMTNLEGTCKHSKSLIPDKYLQEFTHSLKFLKNYRSALSTALAILVMSVTNFAIDAPLTAMLTNKLNSKKEAETPEKEVIYG